MSKYVIWDLETTTKTLFNRRASPFEPDNFIVASGYRRQGEQIFGEYYGRKPKPFDWFTKLLKDTKFLVGVHIKFDLLYALREPQNLEAWMEFVANGGTVWDCQLAEYLLEGQDPRFHMCSMDSMVERYGGNLKNDEVKALWESGVDTIDIDPDLLMHYLVGTDSVHGDIGNTELIFVGQFQRAREQKQMRSIWLNMGSLLATVEMERNGLYVDKPLGLRLAADLEEELKVITEELGAYLPTDLPFDFNWSNRYHLSPLIFGGQVKYKARIHQTDDEGKPAYALKMETGYVCEDGVTRTHQEVEAGGYVVQRFASGKNKGELKTKQLRVPDYDKPKLKWEEQFYTFQGFTEPNPQWKSSTAGLYSVKADVIEELTARNIPFLKTLGRVARLTKDLGTYFITVDKDGNYTGMLTLVGIDSIIHHSINHTSTVTARFSASNPNSQNISKGTHNNSDGKYDEENGEPDGSQIKRVFVSRFEGGSIIQDDFTALEVYIQALLTGCVGLKADLKAGKDMHCVRVSQKEGISYEEAFDLCVIKSVPAWKKKRTEAKVFSFQRAYGAGAAKIAASTGMSESDVKDLIAAEESNWPELKQYNADKMERIKQSRVPTSTFVPHPERPSIQCQLGRGFSVTPDGKRYSYRESPTPLAFIKPGQGFTSFSPTEVANYEVQGAGGEWAKATMWLAVRAFYKAKNFGGRALLVNQVHDALYVDAAEDVRVKAAATLHACMLASNEFMEWFFNWQVDVPVPAVCAYGRNMMEELPFDGNFEALAHRIRLRLRELYIGNYTPSFEQE